jgi:2,3-bisphosphoglycerate-dependent phosphoglycerate mutase
MKKLILLRHGATEWSEKRMIAGTSDIPLSETGRQQARELRARLAKTKFDTLWSSDLERATETANLTGRLPRIDRRLRELDMGDLEGQTWDDLQPEVQDALIAFEGFVAPGGESVDAMKERLSSFIDDLGSGTHVIVTHGGVIRLLLRMSGLEDRPIEPCEIIELEF